MKGRSHRLQSHDDDWVDGSWTVDCVCGVNFDDGEEMVNCDECGVWVHTRCSRYVKGDELFTCDKCKTRNNHSSSNNNNNNINRDRDDSEETEVAQLLVEMPTKTVRLESSSSYWHPPPPPPPPQRSPLKLWTNKPMEERVHVQGVPGGDPALFSGLSSVFSQQLWKCTGYVPKKFSFQYREFPCWDEKKEDENDNTADKGAGVLLSLSKESGVLAVPGTTGFVGFRGRNEDMKVYPKEGKHSLAGQYSEVRRSQIGVSKVFLQSGKRKKDDPELSKDQGGKNKAKFGDRDMDAKKRFGSQAPRPAFMTARDAKPFEFYQDTGPDLLKNNPSAKKVQQESGFQESKPSSYAAVDNQSENPKSNMQVVAQAVEALSSDMSRPSLSAGRRLKDGNLEVQAAVGSSSNVGVTASAMEQNGAGKIQIKQEGVNMPSDGTMDSARADLKPSTDNLDGTALGIKDNQLDSDSLYPCSKRPNIKVEVDHRYSEGNKIDLSSAANTESVGISNDSMSEKSKMKDATLSISPSYDHNDKADKHALAVGGLPTDRVGDLNGGSYQKKFHPKGSEGSAQGERSLSDSRNDFGPNEEIIRSGDGVSKSPALPEQHKMDVCVENLSTLPTAIIPKTPASDNVRLGETSNSDSYTKKQAATEYNSIIKKEGMATDLLRGDDRHISSRMCKECPKSSLDSSKPPNLSKTSHTSHRRTVSDSKDSTSYPVSKSCSTQNSHESSELLNNDRASRAQNKAHTAASHPRGEKFNQSYLHSSSKASHGASVNPLSSSNPSAGLSDEELALLLHQELNSSPRVPRVPRMRHTGSLPSPTATSILMKRTSSSGVKDHILGSRGKSKYATKDGSRRCNEHDDEAIKIEKVRSSPDQRGHNIGYTTLSKREDNGSPAAAETVKHGARPASTSTANSGPSSSTEINDHHLPSLHNSPRHISDEETAAVRVPVYRTLPGLINEIMSKGMRMTYDELCNAVLPHWPNLRKHNGERYAYSSPSQAVLDCLRNRHEWARLVDRGPKTSSSRKRRKYDEDSEDNESEKSRNAKEGEGKSIEPQREEFPKGKRKARKRRRVALQGRGVKDAQKRRKADMLTDDDSGPFSNSSEESLSSEDDDQESGAGPVGSEDSASSDEKEAM